MEECLPYYISLTEGHGTGADCAMRAEALLMRGDDISAEALCHKGIYLASIQGQDSICLACEMTLLRIFLIRGDIEGFENVRGSILKRAKTGTEVGTKKVADMALSFVLVLIREDVSPWLTNLDRVTGNLYNVAVAFGVMTHLRWLFLKGQYAKMIGIAQGSLIAAQQHNFILPQEYFHIFMAVAYHRLGKSNEAKTALDKALFLALPDGIYLPFAEYGEELGALLKARDDNPCVVDIITLINKQAQGAKKNKKSNTNFSVDPKREECRRLSSRATY